MPKRSRDDEAAAPAAPMSALAARRLKQQKQAEAAAPPPAPAKQAPPRTPKTPKTPERPYSPPREELMSARARLEALAASGGRTTPKSPYHSAREEEETATAVPVPIISKEKIQVSNFQRTAENFIEKGEGSEYTVKAVLHAGETLVVQGEYKVEVFKGYVSLYGATLEPGSVYTVYAPSTHSLPVIEYCSKSPNGKKTHNEETEVRLSSHSSGLRNIKNIAPTFRHIWSAHGTRADRSFGVIFDALTPPEILTIPQAWNPYIKSLRSANTEKPPVIVIAGNKASGKSTLTRILTNSFLSQKKFDSVAYLDMDPGQPEFSPSTILTLQNLNELVLGPSWTHSSPGLNPTVLALNYGFTSPRDEPGHYINIFKTLYERYTDLLASGVSAPLIINTAGWTKGLGLELLQEMISYSIPSDFLYIDNNALPYPLTLPPNTKATLIPTAGSSATAQKFSAANLRHLQISTHLHQISQHSWDFTPLTHMAPTLFPYPSTALIELMSETLPPNEYPTALIGTVTAILLPPTDSPFPDPPAAPYLLTPGPHIPTAPCLALAVVRAVDLEKKEVQLLVGGGGAEMLREKNVEKILVSRGRAEMPVWELTAGVQSGWTQGEGSGVWRVRRNLMRRGMVLGGK